MKRYSRKEKLIDIIKAAITDARKEPVLIRDDNDLAHFLTGWLYSAQKGKTISWKK